MTDDLAYCNILVQPACKRQGKWWTAHKHCFMVCSTILFVSRV